MTTLPHWPADPSAPLPKAQGATPAAGRPTPGFDTDHPTKCTAAQKAAQNSKLRRMIEAHDAEVAGIAPVVRPFGIVERDPYAQLRSDVVWVLTWGVVVLPLLIIWAIAFARLMVDVAPIIWQQVGRLLG